MTMVESRCPTFEWGTVADARAYQLRVFEIGEETMEPVLTHTLCSCGQTGD